MEVERCFVWSFRFQLLKSSIITDNNQITIIPKILKPWQVLCFFFHLERAWRAKAKCHAGLHNLNYQPHLLDSQTPRKRKPKKTPAHLLWWHHHHIHHLSGKEIGMYPQAKKVASPLVISSPSASLHYPFVMIGSLHDFIWLFPLIRKKSDEITEAIFYLAAELLLWNKTNSIVNIHSIHYKLKS